MSNPTSHVSRSPSLSSFYSTQPKSRDLQVLEPDDEWKQELRVKIETTLMPLVVDAEAKKENDLKELPQDRVRIEGEFQSTIMSIRKLAKVQFLEELERYREERAYVLGLNMGPNWQEKVLQEQEELRRREEEEARRREEEEVSRREEARRLQQERMAEEWKRLAERKKDEEQRRREQEDHRRREQEEQRKRDQEYEDPQRNRPRQDRLDSELNRGPSLPSTTASRTQPYRHTPDRRTERPTGSTPRPSSSFTSKPEIWIPPAAESSGELKQQETEPVSPDSLSSSPAQARRPPTPPMNTKPKPSPIPSSPERPPHPAHENPYPGYPMSATLSYAAEGYAGYPSSYSAMQSPPHHPDLERRMRQRPSIDNFHQAHPPPGPSPAVPIRYYQTNPGYFPPTPPPPPPPPETDYYSHHSHGYYSSGNSYREPAPPPPDPIYAPAPHQPPNPPAEAWRSWTSPPPPQSYAQDPYREYSDRPIPPSRNRYRHHDSEDEDSDAVYDDDESDDHYVQRRNGSKPVSPSPHQIYYAESWSSSKGASLERARSSNQRERRYSNADARREREEAEAAERARQEEEIAKERARKEELEREERERLRLRQGELERRERARQEELARQEHAKQEEAARERARQEELERERARQEELERERARQEELARERVRIEVQRLEEDARRKGEHAKWLADEAKRKEQEMRMKEEELRKREEELIRREREELKRREEELITRRREEEEERKRWEEERREERRREEQRRLEARQREELRRRREIEEELRRREEEEVRRREEGEQEQEQEEIAKERAKQEELAREEGERRELMRRRQEEPERERIMKREELRRERARQEESATAKQGPASHDSSKGASGPARTDHYHNRGSGTKQQETAMPTDSKRGELGVDLQRKLRLLEKILGDQTKRETLVQMEGDEALHTLDLLQVLVDLPGPIQSSRSDILKIMSRLSKNSRRLPQCLVIQNIERCGKRLIGCGAFGDVWRGKIGDAVTGQVDCAVKAVRGAYLDPVDEDNQDPNHHKALNNQVREAIIWRQLKHPNVLPFLGIYNSDHDREDVCLVSPYMANGNLAQFLRKANPNQVDIPALTSDIASGLEYLHSENVVHGDLKEPNILLTEAYRACICDFGLSRLGVTLGLPPSTYRGGTPGYMALEVMLGGQSTKESDIYSIGTLFFMILKGVYNLSDNVLRGVGAEPRPINLPRDEDYLWSLIQDCRMQEPSARPTTKDVVRRVTAMHNITPALNWNQAIYSTIRNASAMVQ
ncbi:hypothetical protein V5O48_016363 [Marasmius crinis-equi]|uniref:Protein kinase domain-containing protein n=1 Tax=Marasmius crinis-equi TaxID=585013 RepID=A0ABR3ES25_9AGAR